MIWGGEAFGRWLGHEGGALMYELVLKPSRTCGAPGHKSLSVSPILCLQEIGFIQPPRPSQSSKGQVQTVANQGREGRRRQGRNSQETIVQPWGRVLVPPWGIYITISLSCFADTETPTKWEKLTVCCPQARRPQTIWNQKADDPDRHLPHHQPIRRMSTSWSCPPLWTTTVELTTPSRSGQTVLRALARGGPLCLAKQ